MTPEFTDTQRLDWLLDTLYRHGTEGLTKRLRWGCNEAPHRRGIDAEIAKDLKATVRLWKCPRCAQMREQLFVPSPSQLHLLPPEETSPVMCGSCVSAMRGPGSYREVFR